VQISTSYGSPVHAAGAPEKGRSALDGVEAMNYMTNLLREHIPMESRTHYVITLGTLEKHLYKAVIVRLTQIG
jgi:aminobenzoyl-glutamate utilization protein B